MKNNTRKIVLIILCIILSLSIVYVGKALFVFEQNETDKEEQNDDKKNLLSIYIYMVGSDLEDAGLNQLSKLTETLIEDESKYEQEAYDNMVKDRILKFVEEISDMGMTLPNSLYNKTVESEKSEREVDENTLGYGTYSIDMILNSSFADGVQVIIQTGGAKRWLSPYVNPNRSQRFVIDKNGISLVYDEAIVNMADPETLEDFLVFCKEEYPAENEMFVFWDHGNAYGGFGMDNIYGTDMLSIHEIQSCLDNVSRLYSPDEKLFDYIGFDACLMGNLETTRCFKDYAKYYLASPEELSGLGWGYDLILEAVYDNPNISREELGIAVCKANVANVQIYTVDGLFPATFSLIDLDKIEKVYDAYSSFARRLLKDSLSDISYLTKVSSAANKSLAYAYGNSGGFNLIDLGVFSNNFEYLYPNEANAIVSAIKDCVIYTESSSYFKDSTGLSIYYPSKMVGHISLRKYLSYVNDICDNLDIDALYYYKIVGYLNESLRNYVTQQGYGDVTSIDYSKLLNISYIEPSLAGNGNFSVSLPSDYISLIQNVSFGLIFLDSANSDVVYFGEFEKKEIDENNIVNTDFDLYMPSIDGSELPAVQIGEDDEKISYRVPINYYGYSAYMIFTRDKESGEYSIVGFTMGNDNGSASAERTVVEFDEGDDFEVVYSYGNLNYVGTSDAIVRFTYSKDMKIVDKLISDGLYLEYLEFEDLRSDIYYTPIVVIEVKNGKVIDQYIDWGINASDYSKKQ